MTIITTVISSNGLIQASDSNITRSDSPTASSGQKVFHLGFAPAALALAGTYRVGPPRKDEADRMNHWMPACIDGYRQTLDPSIEGFAHYLVARLDEELTNGQRDMATLIHIVGYVTDDDGTHPVMYFVRNAEGMNDTTGQYDPLSPTFRVTEDFWSRDYPQSRAQGTVSTGGYWNYFNGTPDGRVAFFSFGQFFNRFLHAVWAQPSWHFRAPQALDELAQLVDLQIRTIGTLYAVSDYPTPVIGGDPQICQLPPPPGACTLWSAPPAGP